MVKTLKLLVKLEPESIVKIKRFSIYVAEVWNWGNAQRKDTFKNNIGKAKFISRFSQSNSVNLTFLLLKGEKWLKLYRSHYIRSKETIRH